MVAKVTPVLPKLRLADSAVGADIYNYYQIVSLISSMYVKAIDCADEDFYSTSWDGCCESVLAQVGDAYRLWERVQVLGAKNSVQPSYVATLKRTIAFAKRLHEMDRLLNEWVPIKRWARVLAMVERLTLRLGDQIAANSPDLTSRFAKMNKASALRLARLDKILTETLREESELKTNYAEPMAL